MIMSLFKFTHFPFLQYAAPNISLYKMLLAWVSHNLLLCEVRTEAEARVGHR
jgi:hypothetical protein